MSAKFDISAVVSEARRISGISKETANAVKRATSTLSRRLLVEARRDIQTEYNIKSDRVRDGLRTSQGEGYVELVGTARGVGLVNFGARGSVKNGVTYQVLKSGTRSKLSHAFIARGLIGNTQVFERGKVGGKRAGRLPLETVYGPSIAQMLRKEGRAERLGEFAKTILTAEIERLLK